MPMVAWTRVYCQTQMLFLLAALIVLMPCARCRRENVAVGRPCSMTSELNGYPATNAANNDIAHSYSSSNCILTTHAQPYWQVNLGRQYDINQITIFGISNGTTVTELLDSARILVGGTLCYTFEASVNSSDLARHIGCGSPKGSSVRVDRPPNSQNLTLGFCELQVWVCTDGTYGPSCSSQCGSCKDGAACDKSTGVCPAGCAPGYRSTDNKCKTACGSGTYGQNCQQSCSGFCTPTKVCDKVSGTCPCQPGYKTSQCKLPCDNGKYGQDCTSTCGHCAGGAVCNKVNGICTGDCAPGYDPSDRTCKRECANGKYGQDCSKTCSPFCSSQPCNKVYGYCTCKPGYKPRTCDQACDDGKWGQDCIELCGQFCLEGVVCNKANGSCPCKPGYQTPLCTAKCSLGKYGQDCTKTCGFCNANEVCDHVTGSCTRCVDNREMPLCQDCLPGHWGPTCGQLCGHCGGEGRCHPDNGVCLSQVCLNGWTSPLCNQKCSAGWYGPNCSLPCGQCLSKSACRHDSGVCELGCEDGHEGVLCKREKESLVGVIVGSAFGAAALIAVVVVATMCYFKRSATEKPIPPSKDFTTMAETACMRSDSVSSRDSRVYQNVSSEGTHLNPAFSYDHVDMRQNQDVHAYEPHAPDRGAAAAPGKDDHEYQNAGGSSHAGEKWKAGKKGNRQNTYGNIGVAKSEATYGNLQ